MSVVAVIVNCALIGMSDLAERLFPGWGMTERIVLIVVLEVRAALVTVHTVPILLNILLFIGRTCKYWINIKTCQYVFACMIIHSTPYWHWSSCWPMQSLMYLSQWPRKRRDWNSSDEKPSRYNFGDYIYLIIGNLPHISYMFLYIYMYDGRF